jgi:hypothetical protein
LKEKAVFKEKQYSREGKEKYENNFCKANEFSSHYDSGKLYFIADFH